MHGAKLVPSLRMQMEVIEALYCEALLLLDEAHSYFAAAIGQRAAHAGSFDDRMLYRTEAMKTTMRLTVIVSWLLALRTIARDGGGTVVTAQLAPVPAASAECSRLSDDARLLIVASEELYRRAERLQSMLLSPAPEHVSPVHVMVARLESAMTAAHAG